MTDATMILLAGSASGLITVVVGGFVNVKMKQMENAFNLAKNAQELAIATATRAIAEAARETAKVVEKVDKIEEKSDEILVHANGERSNQLRIISDLSQVVALASGSLVDKEKAIVARRAYEDHEIQQKRIRSDDMTIKIARASAEAVSVNQTAQDILDKHPVTAVVEAKQTLEKIDSTTEKTLEQVTQVADAIKEEKKV